MSFWQIFNDCDFSFFGDYNIFLIHLFYFTHHCTSVNRKVICKVGKRERKIKGVFSFFGFNVFKKSQKLAPQRLLTENVCVSKTFFMRFFDVCTYNPLVFTAMLFTTGCKFWVFHEINFAVCFGTQIKNSVVWFGDNAGDDYVALFIKRNNSPLIFGIVGCQINSSFFYDANCVIFGWICSYDFTPFILSFNRFKTLVYPDEIWFFKPCTAYFFYHLQHSIMCGIFYLTTRYSIVYHIIVACATVFILQLLYNWSCIAGIVWFLAILLHNAFFKRHYWKIYFFIRINRYRIFYQGSTAK